MIKKNNILRKVKITLGVMKHVIISFHEKPDGNIGFGTLSYGISLRLYSAILAVFAFSSVCSKLYGYDFNNNV